MSFPTIRIIHPVSITREFLFGADPGFSNKGEILSPALITRIVMTLTASGVVRFDDGLYHGEVHPFGLYDLLSSLSAYDAEQQDFHRVTSAPAKKEMFDLGPIRWEVSRLYKEARVYGPKSDPANIIMIDLLETV